VTPSQGPIAGGVVVSVKGANLGGAAVKLDAAPIAPLSQSDSEVRLQLPAHENGYAVISARNGSGSAYGELLYVPPKLTDIAPGFITTVAGVGVFARDYGPAVNATVTPTGIAFDRAGNLYIAENNFNKISRVRPDGTIERVTATNEGNSSGDGGPAADAEVDRPISVAVDPAGNVYIPDHHYRIRKIDAQTGIISTIAGDGRSGFSGDGGPASASRIGLPTHIAADANDVFFIDFDANRIRRIHLADMTISTFAGNGAVGFSGDGGPATQASFDVRDSDQGALALDPAGNLYLADTNNYRVRQIDRQSGIITTFHVAPAGSSAPDGVHEIRSLAFDAAGNAYYAGSGRVVKLDSGGRFVTSYGNGTYAPPVDGSPVATTGLGHVLGLAIDANGDIVFSDDFYGRVRKINLGSATVTTVAGIGPATIGENGPSLAALIRPNDLAFDLQGRLLIVDDRLRRLEQNGNLVTIGNGAVSIDVDRDGNIDLGELSTVDRIDRAGTRRTIVGHDGSCGLTGDGGFAPPAQLCQAWDTARDGDGNLLIADTNNNRIRRVDARSGTITTIAGNGGAPNGYEGYGGGTSCGDGGPALAACLKTPYGLALDAGGNLFVAGESEIRRIDANGIISTFAANTHANKLAFFHGFLYVARYPSMIVRFDAGANATTLAGTFSSGHSGDGGPALSATLMTGHQAAGVAVDADGNLFFCTGQPTGSRVRAVRYGAVLAPAGATLAMTASGTAITATVRDAAGRPAPSVRVDFTAPTAGATCTFSSAFAITDANGVATVSCAPNCAAGTYSVSARLVNAPAAASVPLTNDGRCKPRAVRH
ncbi:MAG TPA: IPT/TIG domain-containing protein, partial [Thermoanaerobaculia bacterium]|nr:IPT/TIG domain-containing protein [Thermoanaerobaculia bacterium]